MSKKLPGDADALAQRLHFQRQESRGNLAKHGHHDKETAKKNATLRSTMNLAMKAKEWWTKSNISQLILKDCVLDGCSWKNP